MLSLNDDSRQMDLEGEDDGSPLTLAKKRLQQFSTLPAVQPTTQPVSSPFQLEGMPSSDPTPNTPESSPVLKMSEPAPESAPAPLVSPQSTTSGPTMTAPQAPTVAPPPPPPPPPPPATDTGGMAPTNAPALAAPDQSDMSTWEKTAQGNPINPTQRVATAAETALGQHAPAIFTPGTPEWEMRMAHPGAILQDASGKALEGQYGNTPGADGPARYLQGGVEQTASGAPVAGGYNAQADALKQLGEQGYSDMNVSPTGSWMGGTGQNGAPVTPGTASGTSGIGQLNPNGVPQDILSALRGAASGATDAKPSVPVGMSGIAQTAQQRMADFLSSDGGLTKTGQITPGTSSDLLSTAILPGTDIDRFGLAQKRLNEFRTSRQPQHDANVRHILENNAGLGRLGSGMLNTDVGNESLAFERENRDEESRLLNDALEGTIGDSRLNRGEMRGERGYQSGLENQAYGRSVDQYKMEKDDEASAFDQAMRRAQFGEQGNPAGYDIAAGESRRQSASEDMRSYEQLVSGLSQKKAAGDSTAGAMVDWIKKARDAGFSPNEIYDKIKGILPAMSGGRDSSTLNA